MMSRARLVGLLGALAIGLGGAPASAAPAPHWPFEFDANLAKDSAQVKADLAAGDARMPTLDLSLLAPVQVGPVKLWKWPTMVDLFSRAKASGPTAMSWPGGTGCGKHAAFALPPTLAKAGAGASCDAAQKAVTDALADRDACRDADEPERYVLSAPPRKVDLTTTGDLEGLIGLGGEALSHYAPPAGLLEPAFPETLRNVLRKIRAAKLKTRLSSARARYDGANASLTAQAACFDAAAATQAKAAVAGLVAEIDDMSARLAKLEADGESAKKNEARCLAARGREHKMPLPLSLTRAEREFVATYLGGTFWRMRGGGLISLGSTQGARFYFLQQPFTRIGELCGGADGADAAFQIYLAVFEGWGDWQDMGSTPNEGDKYADLVGMTARGERQVKGAVSLLGSRGYATLPLHTGGVQMGPCYFRSFEELYDFGYGKVPSPPYGSFIEGFTAGGEFCSGASIALGLAKSLLDGTPSAAPPSPLCAGLQCGDDGCGGSCGSCGAGLACNAGKCEDATSSPGDAAAASGAAADAAAASAGAAPGDELRAPEDPPPSGCACRTGPRATLPGAVLLALATLLATRRRRR